MTLYQDLKRKRIETKNHYSDLYVKDTPKARELCKAWDKDFTVFTGCYDGERWLDVPFAYDPFWFHRACLSFSRETSIPYEEVKELAKIADAVADCGEHECNGDKFPSGIEEKNSQHKQTNAIRWRDRRAKHLRELVKIAKPHGFGFDLSGLRPTLTKDGKYFHIPE